ncbi:hypothetical protein PHISCL_09924 [Aspergillus sclerotialis]|uniref:RRM domain-containing protein n=1 Tax=Aspergillus sclerotialis TaxID=2070753 RepID=A0A3A2Z4R4_9EURO|nr:hypothetical protein PHISCL_09924 [Aspergillus sclerotialis]
MPVYSIESGMADALGHLKRIAKHFQDQGQRHEANEVGRLSNLIVSVFIKGFEAVPSAEYELEIEQEPLNKPSAKPASVHNNTAIQEQAKAALMNEVERAATSRGLTNALVPIAPMGHGQAHQASTQALVPHPRLATHPGYNAYMHAPQAVPQAAHHSPQLITNSPEGNSGIMIHPSNTVGPVIMAEAKAAIIRVHGMIHNEIIQHITSHIHEGPLKEIRVESRGGVRVEFQHAAHAFALLKSDRETHDALDFGRFGNGYHCELVETVDWNDDHRLMNQPVRERRRLSFARKRLFADELTPEKWKYHVRSLAGNSNIDFLWVFNSGNATAVFTSTSVARRVLEKFNEYKVTMECYKDVSVTFSSDPCEKELVLTNNHHGRHHGSHGSHGRPMGRRPIR